MIRYFCFLIVFVVCVGVGFAIWPPSGHAIVGVGFGIAYFCGEGRKDDSNKV